MARDAEHVAERERDLPPCPACAVDRGAHRGARLFGVPEIAFEIQDRAVGDHRGVDRGGRQELAGAEEGVHGALAVGGDEDQAAAGGRVAGAHGRGELDADAADVVREDLAELVVGDLADEPAFAAERGDAGDRIGSRAAGDLHARAHLGVERVGFLGREHELHRALGDADLFDERVVCGGEDVDDGIADRDDVIGWVGQGELSGRAVKGCRKWRGGLVQPVWG